MKKIALLLAALFCVGGLTNAGAAAPSMDLSHHDKGHGKDKGHDKGHHSHHHHHHHHHDR